MALFGPKGEPRFMNEGTSADAELEQLRALLPRVAPSDRKRLERDIAWHERGLAGERQVRFELANSHRPMCVIQDLYLEREGLSAQIDFLVVTPYVCHVIECKKLVGDIRIDERGSFVRVYGRGRGEEGMYSPVTQNERHLALMKQMLLDERKGVMRWGTMALFEQWCLPIVVLAEDKCVLDAEHAPKDVRDQVIRRDQLVRHIEAVDERFRRRHEFALSEREMAESAERWLGRSSARKVDVEGRYELRAEPAAANPPLAAPNPPSAVPVQPTADGAPSAQSAPEAKAPAQAPCAPARRPPAVVVETSAPACPRCGATMVLRTARRGPNAGRQFWGCSTFPRCRGIVNVGQ